MWLMDSCYKLTCNYNGGHAMRLCRSPDDCQVSNGPDTSIRIDSLYSLLHPPKKNAMWLLVHHRDTKSLVICASLPLVTAMQERTVMEVFGMQFIYSISISVNQSLEKTPVWMVGLSTARYFPSPSLPTHSSKPITPHLLCSPNSPIQPSIP